MCTTTLLNKIRDNFSEDEQHLFLASFYCYLNHDTKKDFVVSLDNIWKWTGFSRKDPAKVLLEKHFIINIDYIVQKAAPPIAGAKNNEKSAPDYIVQKLVPELAIEKNDGEKSAPPFGGAKTNIISDVERRGGANKEIILLTINTFKKFCLKANTKKADEIHNYYIRLEELMQETIMEESDEIKKQLENCVVVKYSYSVSSE
jgi:hypothetical protein